VVVIAETTAASSAEDDEAAAKKPRRWRSLLPGPGLTFGLLLVATALTRLVWLDRPDRALIFDEAYYVNAARRLLGWTVPDDAPYADAPAGIDPNSEHPPLGKLLIAGSMRLFGDDPLGWRFPSLVAGVVVVLAVYLLVRSTGRDPWLPVYAAGVVMLDNLLLVHSRIATLDILFLAPVLVGAVLALRGRWWWAGVACGLAILVKVPAVFGLFALLVFVLVVPGGGSLLLRLRRAFILGGTATIVAAAGLWLLDVLYTDFGNPFEHVRHITSYGLDLSRSGGPVNSESDPWQWLSNDVQIPYLRVDTNEVVGGDVVTTKPSVFFRGAMNPALAGIALTALAYAGWRWIRLRDPLACWSVVWAAGVFVPFVVLSLVSHRISYLFYALPLVPAYSIAAALLMWHEGLPRACRWGFAAALLLGFAAYFPFREILQ
jgi:predicted membrane-bound dolichyl-phosphate-mannose-protein mannosyltransferase